jgi:hypothetical protein
MQVLHYEPVAFALSNSGAGHDGTLVFDSAGFIPYDSGFSLIDPVGLTDNVLSGRDPITPMEREAYIWGSNPDVYLGPVPPAGKGFDEGTNDPVVQSAYAQNVLLNQVMFKSYSRFISDLPHSARLEVLHVRMRELRDNWIAVGEIPYPFPPVPEYTHFLYVRKDSPFADNLVGALSQVVTRKLEEVDFNKVTDGQLRHDFKSVHQIELQLGG